MNLVYRFHIENDNLVFNSELEKMNDYLVHCFEKGSRLLYYWYNFEDAKYKCQLERIGNKKWKADVRGEVVLFKEEEISAQYTGSIKTFKTLVELVPEDVKKMEALNEKGIFFSGISL
jgi:hypothetical protein